MTNNLDLEKRIAGAKPPESSVVEEKVSGVETITKLLSGDPSTLIAAAKGLAGREDVWEYDRIQLARVDEKGRQEYPEAPKMPEDVADVNAATKLVYGLMSERWGSAMLPEQNDSSQMVKEMKSFLKAAEKAAQLAG